MSLTQKIVRDAKPGEKTYVLWDEQSTGLGLRITPKNVKAFVMFYRFGKRKTLMTLGRTSELSLNQAREVHAQHMQTLRSGKDPKANAQAVQGQPTVNELLDRYSEEYLSKGSRRLRKGSKAQYSNLINNHARPILGQMKIADVQYQHVDAMHQRISKTSPTAANRVLAVLSKVFNLAIRWHMIDRNPCHGVERNQEVKRKRYLKTDELARLNEALAKEADLQGANILRLMLLTGCRKGEALAARWDQLDLGAGVWVKPGSTTKQKTEHSAPLSQPAIALLKELERNATADWVFHADSASGHRVAINKTWDRLRKAALIPDVNMHDLRHTYASVLVSAGLSLPVIGALLGHSQPQTTARYAHLQDDPLRDATEQAGAILGGNNVVQLRN